MEKLISCCGLGCAGCDARIATLAGDNDLLTQNAEKWKVHFGADITPEMIKCTGCREAGVKFAHCAECEIRNCVNSKNYETCAACEQLENCEITKSLHQYVPEALLNLKSLN